MISSSTSCRTPWTDPRRRHPQHLVRAIACAACGGQRRVQLQAGRGSARSSPAARSAWLPAPSLASSSTSCRTPWADPRRRRRRHPRYLVRAIARGAWCRPDMVVLDHRRQRGRPRCRRRRWPARRSAAGRPGRIHVAGAAGTCATWCARSAEARAVAS